MNKCLPGTRHVSRKLGKRRAAASLELVMATAVMLPLAAGLLFIGIKICSYVIAALTGLTQMPVL